MWPASLLISLTQLCTCDLRELHSLITGPLIRTGRCSDQDLAKGITSLKAEPSEAQAACPHRPAALLCIAAWYTGTMCSHAVLVMAKTANIVLLRLLYVSGNWLAVLARQCLRYTVPNFQTRNKLASYPAYRLIPSVLQTRLQWSNTSSEHGVRATLRAAADSHVQPER